MFSFYSKMFFVLILSSFFISCENGKTSSNNKRNIRDYYFPIDKLYEGKVYEYQSVENQHDPPFYWHYQTFAIDGNTYFTGMYYDYTFRPFQFVREEVFSNGMSLKDFYWYERDTFTNKQNKVFVNIKAGNVFSFEVSNPPKVVVSSINWKLSTDTLTTMTFIRNRQYNKDTIFTFKNKERPAISLNVLELIDNEKEGHLEQEYAAKEIYAKGIGLVYFEKNIAPEWQMKYELKQIYTTEEFTEKFDTNLLSKSAIE